MEAFWIALIVSVVISLIAVLLIPSPEIPEAKAPNYNDFEFISAKADRVVPEVFGKCRLYGNLTYYDNLDIRAITDDSTEVTCKSWEIWCDESDSTKVGYSYHTNFMLVLARRLDTLEKVYKSDKKSKNLILETNSNTEANSYKSFNFKAGEKSKQYPSNYGNSNFVFDSGYFGHNTTPIEGYGDIKSKVCSVKTSGLAFIGDNVQSMENFNFVGSRYKLFTTQEHKNNNNITPPLYSYDIVTKNVNPAHVINYILKEYMDEELDLTDKVDKDLYDENFFIGFQMTSEKKVEVWLTEILRHIDGVLTKDLDTGKFKLKLIRGDYIDENGDEIYGINHFDESNYSNIKFKRKTWEEVKTKVNFKYTNKYNLKENVLTFNNEAAIFRNTSENVGSYEYFMIQDSKLAKVVLDRVIKKECYPLISCNIKLSMEEFKRSNLPFTVPYKVTKQNYLEIGGVVKLSNREMDFKDKYFRVVNIKAGKELDSDFDVELVEDIFGIEDLDYTDIQEELTKEIETFLSPITNNSSGHEANCIITPSELKVRGTHSLIPMINYNKLDDEIKALIFKTSFYNHEVSGGFNIAPQQQKVSNENRFYKVKVTFPTNIPDYDENIVSTSVIFYNTNFKTKNREFVGNSSDFQKNKFIFIESGGNAGKNQEILTFKSVRKIGGGYEMTGIARGIYGSRKSNLTNTITGYILEIKEKFMFEIGNQNINLHGGYFSYQKINTENYSNILFEQITTSENYMAGDAPKYTDIDVQVISGENIVVDTNNKTISLNIIKESLYNKGAITFSADALTAGTDENAVENGEIFLAVFNNYNFFYTNVIQVSKNAKIDYSVLNQNQTQCKIYSYIPSKGVKSDNLQLTIFESFNLQNNYIYGNQYGFIKSAPIIINL